MRIYFPNLTRPKKASQVVASALGLSLAVVQQGVAKACGHRDWHDLENQHTSMPPSLLDQHIDHMSYVDRQIAIVLNLATELGVPDGDVQYGLASSRLTGDRPAELADQIAIRVGCWRRTSVPMALRSERGAVGRLKAPGRNKEVVILRSFGRPTIAITHKNVLSCADFECVSPGRFEVAVARPVT
jgi:hypothetical protein